MYKIIKKAFVAFVLLGMPFFVLADHSTDHTIAQLKEQIAVLEARIQALLQPAEKPETVSCPAITRALALGSTDAATGGEVTRLQRYLATDPDVYPEGSVTGYYGKLTRQAVGRWQVKYGVVPQGATEALGYGTVGPRTRMKISERCAGTVAIIPDRDQETVALKEGEGAGSFVLQKIYPDHVTGLNHVAYPLPTVEGNPVTLRIGGMVSNGCTVQLTLLRIDGTTAYFSKKTNLDAICPICLSGTTLIDTPSGAMLVKDMKIGMPIWTTDSTGHRIAGTVDAVSSTPVPATHQVVHLVLDDGRALLVSPGHPTIDRRTVGNLVVGDQYDGATIEHSDRVPYSEGATYDVLPSGDTGYYWANGVLLDSTLRVR